jgi:hypothetical protein
MVPWLWVLSPTDTFSGGGGKVKGRTKAKKLKDAN